MDALIFSKMFLGIESEGPWIGLPFLQLSIGGCGRDCVHCLDPEQRSRPDLPALVLGERGVEMSGQTACDLLMDAIGVFLTGKGILSDPHHITFDMGCAEYGMGRDECLWWTEFFAIVADYAKNNLLFQDILVENTSGRPYALHPFLDNLHYHFRYDSFRGVPAHEYLVNVFSLFNYDHDRIKLVVHSLEDYKAFAADWPEFLINEPEGYFGVESIPHGYDLWFMLVLSPKLPKEEAEAIMADFELGRWHNCARLIMPQHFFLDRWDR